MLVFCGLDRPRSRAAMQEWLGPYESLVNEAYSPLRADAAVSQAASFYLCGGRDSIAEFCRDNQHQRITIAQGTLAITVEIVSRKPESWLKSIVEPVSSLLAARAIEKNAKAHASPVVLQLDDGTAFTIPTDLGSDHDVKQDIKAGTKAAAQNRAKMREAMSKTWTFIQVHAMPPAAARETPDVPTSNSAFTLAFVAARMRDRDWMR